MCHVFWGNFVLLFISPLLCSPSLRCLLSAVLMLRCFLLSVDCPLDNLSVHLAANPYSSWAPLTEDLLSNTCTIFCVNQGLVRLWWIGNFLPAKVHIAWSHLLLPMACIGPTCYCRLTDFYSFSGFCQACSDQAELWLWNRGSNMYLEHRLAIPVQIGEYLTWTLAINLLALYCLQALDSLIFCPQYNIQTSVCRHVALT